MPAEAVSDKAGRASAEEGVKHGASLRTSGENARLDQFRRVGGEMCLAEWLGRHRPDGSLVTPHSRLFVLRHRIPAVVESSMPAAMAPLLVASTGTANRLHGAVGLRSSIGAIRSFLGIDILHPPLDRRMLCGFADRFIIVVITLAFGEQEDIFMAFRWSVGHALRHGVGL